MNWKSGDTDLLNYQHDCINYYRPGADLGFFKRESKILGSDRCDVIVMTSPKR